MQMFACQSGKGALPPCNPQECFRSGHQIHTPGVHVHHGSMHRVQPQHIPLCCSLLIPQGPSLQTQVIPLSCRQTGQGLLARQESGWHRGQSQINHVRMEQATEREEGQTIKRCASTVLLASGHCHAAEGQGGRWGLLRACLAAIS
eukprot:1150583-Pelagomonas_calceolata.AAC.3